MISLDIPGFGHVSIEHIVTDFTGTLARDGKLIPGVREKFEELSKTMTIHVLTSDTFGTAEKQLAGLTCELVFMQGPDQDVQKETYVRKLGADSVVSFGNGRNDVAMLRLARVGVAVAQSEGCNTSALKEADVFVTSIIDGLGLLTDTRRLLATLRY